MREQAVNGLPEGIRDCMARSLYVVVYIRGTV